MIGPIKLSSSSYAFKLNLTLCSKYSRIWILMLLHEEKEKKNKTVARNELHPLPSPDHHQGTSLPPVTDQLSRYNTMASLAGLLSRSQVVYRKIEAGDTRGGSPIPLCAEQSHGANRTRHQHQFGRHTRLWLKVLHPNDAWSLLLIIEQSITLPPRAAVFSWGDYSSIDFTVFPGI